MTLEALSREKHRYLRLQAVDQPWAFASKLMTAGVVGAELPEVVRTMPAAFRLQDGKATMLALMGLGEQNLYVGEQGQWLGRYIPAVLRAWPFSLVTRGDQRVVVINTASPAVSRDTGDALFNDQGEPTERLQKILDFLQAVGDQELAMARAVAAIVEADLLVPWEFNVRNVEGKTKRITGLHQVDQKAFDALDDAAFLKLRRAGALPLIYGHWFSQRNVSELERLQRERRHLSADGSPEPPQPLYITDEYLRF